MGTPFHERPERSRRIRRTEITYEGENAHIAFMSTVPKMVQAMYSESAALELQAKRLELEAQKIEMECRQLELAQQRQLECDPSLNRSSLNGTQKHAAR